MLRKELIDRLAVRNRQVAQAGMGPTFLRKILTNNFRNFAENGSAQFDSPITAIVGRNGTGKSTLLHLAGCAFAPPPVPGTTLTGGKTFNDFIPDSAKDKMPLGSIYGFEYGDGTIHKFKWIERGGGRSGLRTWDRRGQRTDRRQRNTVFLGFEKNIPNVLSLGKYFGLSQSEIDKRLSEIGMRNQFVALDQQVVSQISRISGKNYAQIERRTDGYSMLSEHCAGYIVDGQYSDIASGSGEISIIRMVDAVSSASPNSIIILDEPEAGIHQIAQQNLLEFLVDQATRPARNHQIIYTTHSEYLLDGLSPASIMLLRSFEGKVLSAAVNKAVALKDIGHSIDKKAIAYVEDDFAADMLAQVLEVAPSTRELIHIEQSNAEGWINMIKREFPRAYAIYRHSQYAPKPVFVLDGDVSSKIDVAALTSQFGSVQRVRNFARAHSVDSLISQITRLSGAGSAGVINFRSLFKQYIGARQTDVLVRLIAEYVVISDNMNVRLASPCRTTPKITSAGLQPTAATE